MRVPLSPRSLILLVLLTVSFLAGPAGADFTFRLQTPDPASSGQYASLALDALGRPHIAAYDFGTGNLKYSLRSEGVWSTRFVDTPGNVGKFASLALSAEGRPRIAYHDATAGALKYAERNGDGTWSIETVDSGSRAGLDCSLALDSRGDPHIAYFVALSEEIVYARRIEGEWTFDVVDDLLPNGGTTLVLDSGDRPHLSYFDTISDEGAVLVYRTVVDEGEGGLIWSYEVVDDSPFLKMASLALDPDGQPHVSYRDDGFPGGLRYASREGTSWSITVVDGPGAMGEYSSLALNGKGEPFISYLDALPGDLKVAYRTAAGWATQVVDAQGRTGLYTSLALDAKGFPAIAYHDESLGDLDYAEVIPSDPPPAPQPPVESTGGNDDLIFLYARGGHGTGGAEERFLCAGAGSAPEDADSVRVYADAARTRLLASALVIRSGPDVGGFGPVALSPAQAETEVLYLVSVLVSDPFVVESAEALQVVNDHRPPRLDRLVDPWNSGFSYVPGDSVTLFARILDVPGAAAVPGGDGAVNALLLAWADLSGVSALGDSVVLVSLGANQRDDDNDWQDVGFSDPQFTGNGRMDFPEPYVDENGNGGWDPGESFLDLDAPGYAVRRYDAGDRNLDVNDPDEAGWYRLPVFPFAPPPTSGPEAVFPVPIHFEDGAGRSNAFDNAVYGSRFANFAASVSGGRTNFIDPFSDLCPSFSLELRASAEPGLTLDNQGPPAAAPLRVERRFAAGDPGPHENLFVHPDSLVCLAAGAYAPYFDLGFEVPGEGAILLALEIDRGTGWAPLLFDPPGDADGNGLPGIRDFDDDGDAAAVDANEDGVVDALDGRDLGDAEVLDALQDPAADAAAPAGDGVHRWNDHVDNDGDAFFRINPLSGGRLWFNIDERPDNGLDDDGDGFIDEADEIETYDAARDDDEDGIQDGSAVGIEITAGQLLSDLEHAGWIFVPGFADPSDLTAYPGAPAATTPNYPAGTLPNDLVRTASLSGDGRVANPLDRLAGPLLGRHLFADSSLALGAPGVLSAAGQLAPDAQGAPWPRMDNRDSSGEFGYLAANGRNLNLRTLMAAQDIAPEVPFRLRAIPYDASYRAGEAVSLLLKGVAAVPPGSIPPAHLDPDASFDGFVDLDGDLGNGLQICAFDEDFQPRTYTLIADLDGNPDDVGSVDFQLWNGTSWESLGIDGSAPYSLPWTPAISPAADPDTVRFRAVTRDPLGNPEASSACRTLVDDQGNPCFELEVILLSCAPPRPVLEAPLPGDVVPAASLLEIRWSNEGGPAETVTILYSLDGGGTFTDVVRELPWVEDRFEWTTPDTASAMFRIQVELANGFGRSDAGSDNDLVLLKTPRVTLLSPAAGEIRMPGETADVVWENTGGPADAVTLELSLDGGTTYADVLRDLPWTEDRYAWTVPDTASVGARLRVTLSNEAGASGDDGNGDFIIGEAPIAVLLSPVGGESWVSGSRELVQWRNDGGVASEAVLDFSSDGGRSWSGIATLPGDTDGYTWTVPPITTGQGRVRVTLSGPAGSSSDISPGDFRVQSPLILTLTSPNGGELWVAGASQTVSWLTEGASAETVSVELSLDDGATWVDLARDVAVTGASLGVTAPDTSSVLARVRLTASGAGAVAADTSDEPFVVLAAPRGTWLEPAGGEIWMPGESRQLAWSNTGGPSGATTLEYSLDGGSTWDDILRDGPGDGGAELSSYSWTVPEATADDVRLRLTLLNQAGEHVTVSGSFRILDLPRPSFTTPGEAAVVAGGAPYLVTWENSGGVPTSFTLEYSADNGSTFVDLVRDGTWSENSFSWSVPLVTVEQARLRLTLTHAGGSTGTLSSVFGILAPPLVGLNSLEAPLALVAGDGAALFWVNAGGPAESFRLEYTVDGGATWTLMAQGPAAEDASGRQEYLWRVADVDADPLQVRVVLANAAGEADRTGSPGFVVERRRVSLRPPSLAPLGAYRLWSMPLAPQGDPPPTLLSLFGDELGRMGRFSWKAFGLVGSETRIDPPAVLGTGFWINSLGQLPAETRVTGLVPVLVDIPLVEGWNAVGVPSDIPQALGDFRIVLSEEEGGEVLTLDEAVDRGVIAGGFYEYVDSSPDLVNNGSYSVLEIAAPGLDSLEPWRGHLVRAFRDCVLRLDAPARVPISAGERRDADPAVAGNDLSRVGDWLLELSAESGKLLDGGVEVGVVEGTRAGFDRRDLPKPPPPGESLQLAVEHGDWGDRSGLYLRSLVPGDESDPGFHWDLVLTGSGERAQLHVRGLERLPEGLTAYVVLEDGLARPLKAGESIDLRTVDGEARGRLVVTATPWDGPILPAGGGGIRALGPNPLAGGPLTIRYDSPGVDHARLRVFDVSGRLVRDLGPVPREAGTWTARWDGRDGSGDLVGAGVYFLNLELGSTRHAARLVVLR